MPHNSKTQTYKYEILCEFSNDRTPEIFAHHYGACYEDDFIPQPYQCLRYELFNYLLDDVDRVLDSELIGMDYARYYEYILIPIKGMYLTTPISQVVANTVIKINDILHKCQFPLPMIELARKGSKFESFKEGFRVRVDGDGCCQITHHRKRHITGLDYSFDAEGKSEINPNEYEVVERIDDDS